MSKPDGGPANPKTGFFRDEGPASHDSEDADGMTLRDCACIELRVPETGKPWLDEIIRKGLRNDFAGQALMGFLTCQDFMNELAKIELSKAGVRKRLAEFCYKQADALLEACETTKET